MPFPTDEHEPRSQQQKMGEGRIDKAAIEPNSDEVLLSPATAALMVTGTAIGRRKLQVTRAANPPVSGQQSAIAKTHTDRVDQHRAPRLLWSG